MNDPVDIAFADAVYPHLRNTGDRRLRAEAIRRARKARAVLADAGFEIVRAHIQQAADAVTKGERDDTDRTTRRTDEALERL